LPLTVMVPVVVGFSGYVIDPVAVDSSTAHADRHMLTTATTDKHPTKAIDSLFLT